MLNIEKPFLLAKNLKSLIAFLSDQDSKTFMPSNSLKADKNPGIDLNRLRTDIINIISHIKAELPKPSLTEDIKISKRTVKLGRILKILEEIIKPISKPQSRSVQFFKPSLSLQELKLKAKELAEHLNQLELAEQLLLDSNSTTYVQPQETSSSSSPAPGG